MVWHENAYTWKKNQKAFWLSGEAMATKKARQTSGKEAGS